MKKLFDAIRKGDEETVKACLDKKPALIACTAGAPKQYVGQSPLQVAIQECRFDIAGLLLDRGADVNFMEADDCGSDRRNPVVHDAVAVAVLSVRIAGTERMDQAFAVLERMVAMGADLTKPDLGGRTALDVALNAARRVLPPFNYEENRYVRDEPVPEKTDRQLRRVFGLIRRAAPGLSQRSLGPQYHETLLQKYLTL